MTEQRKLAAVMFTDIVGYTTLMSKDEQKALKILQKNRDLQKSLAEKHNGEFLKEMGDGTLLCFQSALDAVRCAMEIQKSVQDDSDLNLRIGIHLGDIVFKEGDVFGDGVNVASRIERLAQAGGICISEGVDKLIRNHPEIKTVFIGEKPLKNVSQPVKIYSIADADSSRIAERVMRESRRTRYPIIITGVAILALVFFFIIYRFVFTESDKFIDSIAVLPLVNLTGDEHQEYFVEGMTDALIKELAQISALRVISRQSVMQFKNSPKALPDIAEELNVDALVEGTVLSSDEQVRITVQLLKAKPEQHLWADDYIRDFRSIIELQQEVARNIASKIRVTITREEQERLASARPVDPEAHRVYLKGRYYWNQRTDEGILKAIDYFKQAIDVDPDYAAAYAGLADCYVVAPAHYTLLPRESYPKARTAALKALEIDDQLAEAYVALAAIKHNYDWDWAEAEQIYQKGIEMNPNYATAHQWYGELLCATDRPDEAYKEFQRAHTLDPLSSIINSVWGDAFLCVHDNDSAIVKYKEALDLNPNFAVGYNRLSVAYLQKEMHEEAIAAAQKAEALSDNPWATAHLGYVYAMADKKHEAEQKLHEMMKIPGQDLVPHAGTMAYFYVGLNNYDQAFLWLEKAYEQRDYFLVYAKVTPEFDPFRSDRRFKELLIKMGLEDEE